MKQLSLASPELALVAPAFAQTPLSSLAGESAVSTPAAAQDWHCDAPADLPQQGMNHCAWIDYRDGHCAAEGAKFAGGSIRPLIENACKAALTGQRTEELLLLLEEG